MRLAVASVMPFRARIGRGRLAGGTTRDLAAARQEIVKRLSWDPCYQDLPENCLYRSEISDQRLSVHIVFNSMYWRGI